jgi:signal peptide peptidase-like protein 2B
VVLAAGWCSCCYHVFPCCYHDSWQLTATAAAAVVVVVACCRLDIAGKTTWHGGYYVASVMGYGSGLLLTYVALMFSWFGDEGQPALLYLVPCTLGVVLLLAAVRGELRALLTAGTDAGDSGVGGYEYEAVGSGSAARAGAELLDDDDDRDGSSGVGGGEDALVAIDGQGVDVQQGVGGGLGKPARGLAGTAAAAADRGGRAGASRQQRNRGRGQGRPGRPDAFV